MQLVETQGKETASNQILHPGSRALFRYWEALRAERACPTREEFSLQDIPDIVPDLVILERDHIRHSFRYRLAGTRACEIARFNLTGSDALAGWDAFERDAIYKHMVQTTVNMQPTLMRQQLTTDAGQKVAVEFIGLPVRMRGSERLQIVGGMFAFVPMKTIGHTAIINRELLAIRSIWTEYQLQKPDNTRQEVFRRFAVIPGGLAS
jgi:hypothetical protein